MADTHLDNVHNAIVGSTVTTEGGDVLVNGHKVTNYFYSAQYQDLNTQDDELQEHVEKTRAKIAKYPDDEDFKADLLKLSGKRNEIRKKLEELKQEVIRLAETFTKIPINSERLKLARQHFEAGNFSAARAILEDDVEQMGNDLDALLDRDDHLQQQQAQIQALRLDKADEFLILARLTALDFDLPNRFGKTNEYFQRSLKAAHTRQNTAEYAIFLQMHNQLNAVQPWYEEALEILRHLACANPDTYLPEVAGTLNNLATMHIAKDEFPAAQASFDEALELYRRLAAANSATYLPKVAMTLNNLGFLHRARNDVAAAQAAYDEALQIYRPLAGANPETYLPDVAMTLNNLGDLYRDRNDVAAQAAYDEALELYRHLANVNPLTYLPDLAATLNNLATVHIAKDDFPVAQAGYEQALKIYRRLPEATPLTYLPDLAGTQYNRAILYTGKNEFPTTKSAYDDKIRCQWAEAALPTYLPNLASTLCNLAKLYSKKYEFPEAQATYSEALEMYRCLALVDPEAYLPNLAATLNNLATLHMGKDEFLAAQVAYDEAIELYRRLADADPKTYRLNVVATAMNLSIFYKNCLPDRDKSLAYAGEAFAAAWPFVKVLPAYQEYARAALQVVEAWGMDTEAFLEATFGTTETE